VPHGEFQEWIEANAGERGIRTLQKWMKLAKTNLDSLLTADLGGLKDAYIATGILPEPTPKIPTEGDDAEKPGYVLSFRAKWHQVSEWNKDSARDFLYEFDRLAQLARALKTEFGL